jgi:uncharacterized membrane protein YeiH
MRKVFYSLHSILFLLTYKENSELRHIDKTLSTRDDTPMLQVLIWLGTITFAASGALTAIGQRFDFIGVLVLASVTAVGGGAIRDVLVGQLPPASLQNESLLWVVFATALLTFFFHRYIKRLGRLPYLLDTLGLALFAALGAQQGITYGLGFWGVVFTGTVSGVGGGLLKDVLSRQIPVIFYRSGDFYASAAAVGSGVIFLLHPLEPTMALLAGVVTTIVMRVGSRWLGLTLPVPRE